MSSPLFVAHHIRKEKLYEIKRKWNPWIIGKL